MIKRYVDVSAPQRLVAFLSVFSEKPFRVHLIAQRLKRPRHRQRSCSIPRPLKTFFLRGFQGSRQGSKASCCKCLMVPNCCCLLGFCWLGWVCCSAWMNYCGTSELICMFCSPAGSFQEVCHKLISLRFWSKGLNGV